MTVHTSKGSAAHASDLIILPGTKSLMQDLLWMRQNGLEAQILKAQKAGTAIAGVCGAIRCSAWNFDRTASKRGGVIRGMGLLDTTLIRGGKGADQSFRHYLRGKGGSGRRLRSLPDIIEGYGVHMGTDDAGAVRSRLPRSGFSRRRDEAGRCMAGQRCAVLAWDFDSEASWHAVVRW